MSACYRSGGTYIHNKRHVIGVCRSGEIIWHLLYPYRYVLMYR